MTRRTTVALASLALLASAGTARAQRASVALGAAVPAGDYANSATGGLDVAFQVRTEPMIGPLALRLEIGYDHLAGKGAIAGTSISSQGVSLMGEIGSRFYWTAGPGYYQSSAKTQIAGHNVNDQRSYFGAQAALGVDIPVFRWDGFLEVSGVKLFSPGVSLIYVPLRFGIRL